MQVKTANKQIRGLRQGKNKEGKGFNPNDDDNDEITFDYVLSEIIGSTLANKMGKNDPEYKVFKESFDHVNTYFIERFSYISDELIYEIFSEINRRSKDLVTVVSKNMMDFCDLVGFFVQCLEKVNSQVLTTGTNDAEDVEQENLFKKIVDTFTHLGNSILNEDPQQTELYFLEYCLNQILDIMTSNEFKRNQLAVVLYCFCGNSANAHLRVLRRIKQKIGLTHKTEFIAIVNSLLEFDEVTEDQYLWGSADLFDFYFEVAVKGLHATSPVARTKALSILSQLAPCSLKPIFDLLPTIKRMTTVQNWELQGQLLILSNCALQEMCNEKIKMS